MKLLQLILIQVQILQFAEFSPSALLGGIRISQNESCRGNTEKSKKREATFKNWNGKDFKERK